MPGRRSTEHVNRGIEAGGATRVFMLNYSTFVRFCQGAERLAEELRDARSRVRVCRGRPQPWSGASAACPVGKRLRGWYTTRAGNGGLPLRRVWVVYPKDWGYTTRAGNGGLPLRWDV